MKEICLPFGGIADNESAEVTIKSQNSDKTWKYRVVSFNIQGNNIDLIIKDLREKINRYDPEWELIQIFDNTESKENVHVLYRKKVS
jgi:hypothetical protein